MKPVLGEKQFVERKLVFQLICRIDPKKHDVSFQSGNRRKQNDPSKQCVRRRSATNDEQRLLFGANVNEISDGNRVLGMH